MDLQNVNENRELFVKYMGQTSDYPLGIEIDRAKGVYLYDKEGNAYMDLISGLSVNNLGHCHPKIVKAIREQAEKYLHVMVYGEFVQSPQVELATLLQSVLPPSLCSSFFVNSGSEAVEGALKLAKKFTGRTEIMGFKNAYHGSTHGAFSLIGNELFRNAFRPLLPDVKHLTFNDFEELRKITSRTACVVVEPIQAEAGIVEPQNDFLKALGKRCKETGTLLVFDEVQTGFGRTGSLFAFEQFGVVPDILVLGKALGGGMPVAAFVSSREIMSSLKKEPVLGHITTFGGHPICCASAIASLSTLLKEDILMVCRKKEICFIAT
jgi:acetylornithine/N-succinyldiaminopimelate aminotransferase